jgi:hypothetical protein
MPTMGDLPDPRDMTPKQIRDRKRALARQERDERRMRRSKLRVSSGGISRTIPGRQPGESEADYTYRHQAVIEEVQRLAAIRAEMLARREADKQARREAAWQKANKKLREREEQRKARTEAKRVKAARKAARKAGYKR